MVVYVEQPPKGRASMGCCRPDNVCGYNLSKVFTEVEGEVLDYGLGCASYAQVGQPGAGDKCDFTALEPDAGGGFGDAGVLTPGDAGGGATQVDAGTPSCGPTCQPREEGPIVGSLSPCCDLKDRCGSIVPQLLDYGFPEGQVCIARDQQSRGPDVCPAHVYQTKQGETVSANGCCRMDFLCGYDLSSMSEQHDAGAKDLSFGLGCVSYAELGVSLTPGSCQIF